MGVSMPNIEEITAIASDANLPISFNRRMIIQGVSMGEIRALADAFKANGVCYHRGAQWGQPKAKVAAKDQ